MSDPTTSNDTEALAEALAQMNHDEGLTHPMVASHYRHKAEQILASPWLAARDAAVRAEAVAGVLALHPRIPIRQWADDCNDESHVHDPDDLGIADVCFTCPPAGEAVCGRCYDGDGGDHEAWPCPTVRAALPGHEEGKA